MKNSLKFLLGIAILTLLQFGACGERLDSYQAIISDDNIQAQIARVVSALHKHWENQATEDEAINELEKLKSMDNAGVIVLQVISYKIRCKDEKKFHAAMIILGYLYSEIPEGELLKAIIPYLGTKNSELKEELDEMLLFIDKKSNSKEFELFIRDRRDNPPPLPLIQYMYEKSPNTALLTLMNIYSSQSKEEKEIITISKDIIEEDIKNRYYGPMEEKANISPEAISSLNELSKYKQWWIHLYVAEIIKQHPEFNNSQIIERLKQDKHPLVQKALNEIEDK